MGIAERKTRHKEETKGAILEAAWQIVKSEGWQTLSIRKIADAIEYSVPVVYTHFENKEAILLEFTKEGFRLLTKKLLKARDTQKTPDKQLEAIAKAYWDFAFEQPEFYQVMFGLGIPACEKGIEVSEMKAFGEVIGQVIKQAIGSGKNKKADEMLKFHTFWSILHGLVSIQMIGKNHQSAEMKQMILKDAMNGFIKSI